MPVLVKYFSDNTSCQGHPPIVRIRVINYDLGREWEFWMDPPLECHELRNMGNLPVGNDYWIHILLEGSSSESLWGSRVVIPGENQWVL